MSLGVETAKPVRLVAATLDENKTKHSPIVKKKPGRPRKTLIVEETEHECTHPRRKRGRPKKVVPVVEETVEFPSVVEEKKPKTAILLENNIERPSPAENKKKEAQTFSCVSKMFHLPTLLCLVSLVLMLVDYL